MSSIGKGKRAGGKIVKIVVANASSVDFWKSDWIQRWISDIRGVVDAAFNAKRLREGGTAGTGGDVSREMKKTAWLKILSQVNETDEFTRKQQSEDIKIQKPNLMALTEVAFQEFQRILLLPLNLSSIKLMRLNFAKFVHELFCFVAQTNVMKNGSFFRLKDAEVKQIIVDALRNAMFTLLLNNKTGTFVGYLNALNSLPQRQNEVNELMQLRERQGLNPERQDIPEPKEQETPEQRHESRFTFQDPVTVPNPSSILPESKESRDPHITVQIPGDEVINPVINPVVNPVTDSALDTKHIDNGATFQSPITQPITQPIIPVEPVTQLPAVSVPIPISLPVSIPTPKPTPKPTPPVEIPTPKPVFPLLNPVSVPTPKPTLVNSNPVSVPTPKPIPTLANSNPVSASVPTPKPIPTPSRPIPIPRPTPKPTPRPVPAAPAIPPFHRTPKANPVSSVSNPSPTPASVLLDRLKVAASPRVSAGLSSPKTIVIQLDHPVKERQMDRDKTGITAGTKIETEDVVDEEEINQDDETDIEEEDDDADE